MMQTLFVLIPGLWLGFILGISFLEAPLKFRAPGITRELGLGIGKLVFTALNRVEGLLGILLSFVSWKTNLQLQAWIILGALLLLLLFQTFILLPKLTKRVAMIQSGISPPPSNQHWFYILLEVMKVVLLLLFVFQM